MYACPSCSRLFSESEIDEHAFLCLTRVDSSQAESSSCETSTEGSSTPLSATRRGTATPAAKRNLLDYLSVAATCKSSRLEEHLSACDTGTGVILQSSEVNDMIRDTPCPWTSKSIIRQPLAERMRPTCIDELRGQSIGLKDGGLLTLLSTVTNLPSMVLWGPPGCGKTSFANIIRKKCELSGGVQFTAISAASGGITEFKAAIAKAKHLLKFQQQRTVLFVDEIHHLNKLQQDIFLPSVEQGHIILLGATTENPSFHLNGALLSRCRVLVFQRLSTDDVCVILYRAIAKLGYTQKNTGGEIIFSSTSSKLMIGADAVSEISKISGGDARFALNTIETLLGSDTSVILETSGGMTLESTEDTPHHLITRGDVVRLCVRLSLPYDRAGDDHYNAISALHKSIRGSDRNAALYWLARMLESGEKPLYVARRLIRIASEDVGLADPNALVLAVAAYQAAHLVGMPECDVVLAQVVVYLADAQKSVLVYKAYGRAKAAVMSWVGPHPTVPLHLRNAPTKLMQDLGFGRDYKYPPDDPDHVDQQYLPPELVRADFFADS